MKKTIVLGVCGGIAAFKAAQLTSNLIKKGYDVEVIMTKNATEFITPLTFESLTRHNVMIDTFEKVVDRSVKHISIAKRADAFVLIPATANVIAKVVHGLADDMLTTTFLAAKCPKIICPAMNTNMYKNPITQQNLQLCRQYGFQLIEPESGYLACGDTGQGKLAQLSTIEQVIETLFQDNILKGKRVLVTAGPTQEALDPVRFISNHSSGKMGYAIAQAAYDMGADVTLIHGPVHLEDIPGVHAIAVTSAQEMMDAVKKEYETHDFIIKAAAVSDYRAEVIAKEKRKKQDDTIQLTFVKNEDILAYLGKHKKTSQVLCGFAMETTNVLASAQEKMKRKQCDMLIVNDLRQEGAGFQHDTNVVTMLYKDQRVQLPLMKKYTLGQEILKQMLVLHKQQKGS